MDSHPSNRPAKIALNLLNLLKEKQQQPARERRGLENNGGCCCCFLNSLTIALRGSSRTPTAPSGRPRRGSAPLGASESASRRNGQGGQRMCQRPLRAPMGRTLFCRRTRERIWLGKGPVALLVEFFWPGNTLTYINPLDAMAGVL